jgi:hypothetical protein
MAKKKLKIEKDPENEIPVQILEQAILDISSGLRKIRSGRLNDRAIILLVQYSVGTAVVTQAQVKAVLDAATNLDRHYFK